MNVITVDVESFFSTDHSLTKMSPIAYCMSPKTEIISLAIKLNNYPTDVFFGEAAIRKALAGIQGTIAGSMLLAHNMSGFDSMILAWRFGLKPKMWGCTLAMARPIHSKTTGNSLGKLVEHYGLGRKDSTALMQTKGRNLAGFTPAEIEAMRRYNRDDVDQCYALFQKLKPHYNAKELWQIDATIRMLVEPKFEVNRPLLETALSVERDHKRRAILTLARYLKRGGNASKAVQDAATIEDLEEAVRSEMASAPKFSEILKAEGVKVPMKPSPSNPEKQVPALAKTDEAFVALQDHDNEVVAAAARARLVVKSTILETRIEAFLEASGAVSGKLPVPLNYCGADTTGRWSGWAYNPQNLSRINPTKPKTSDALRNCMRAPKGHKIVVADLSGIELRVNMFLWKVPYAMALFTDDPEKADLYKTLASTVFSVPFDEVQKSQRQAAKAMHLGCGFGLGSADKFVSVAKMMAQIDITVEEAQGYITSYRETHPEVVEGWKTCGRALTDVASGTVRAVDPWGLISTQREALRLPSGRLIRYPNMRIEDDGTWPDGRAKKSMLYATGRHKARINGPKAVENCIAEGTEVLTTRGWVPIEDITQIDAVHDGVEFVQHGGLVCKQVQSVIPVDGVYMTPDHEVLTDDGWKPASEGPRPFRPDIRGADNFEHGGQRWTPHAVAVPVPVWRTDRSQGGKSYRGSETGRQAQLRVPDSAVDVRGEPTTRYEQAPSLRGVPEHDRQVPSPIASSLEKLRSAGYHGVSSVGRIVREFLGGHGQLVPSWAGLGSPGQRRAVFAGELPMGQSPDQYDEQAEHGPTSGHSGSEQGHGYRKNNTLRAAESWMASGASGHPTGVFKPVYDIVNCGPRHRFVVRGTEGPFIVHNCVQALARDIIADNALDFYKTSKMRPALMVHDELVYVVPESAAQGALDELQAIMRTPPKWWKELAVWSEGDIADTYGAAK